MNHEKRNRMNAYENDERKVLEQVQDLTIKALEEAAAPIDVFQINEKVQQLWKLKYPIRHYDQALIRLARQKRVTKVGLEKHSLLPTWEINREDKGTPWN